MKTDRGKPCNKGIFWMILLLCLCSFSGCQPKISEKLQESSSGKENQQSTEGDFLETKGFIRVGTIKGPTGMGMVGLMDKDQRDRSSVDYEFFMTEDQKELAEKIMRKEIDAAALSTNLAAALYQETQGQVQLLAVNTLGVLCLIENGESIRRITDLKGKEVTVSKKGTSSNAVLQHLLEANGIDTAKEVSIRYEENHKTLVDALARGEVSIGLLPQPHATDALMQNSNLRTVLDISKEWEKVNPKSQLVMGAMIARKEFVEKNKALVDLFLAEYQESIKFVNHDRDKAAILIEEFEILPKASIAEKALPLCNIVYIPARDAKGFLNDFYQVMFRFDAQSIGGDIPAEDFYYR